MGGLWRYLLKVNPTVEDLCGRRRGPAYYGDDQPSSTWVSQGTRLCPRTSGITAARHPKSYTWGEGLAQRQLSAHRQEHRDSAGHVFDPAGIRQNPARWKCMRFRWPIRTPDGLVLVVGCSHRWGGAHTAGRPVAIDPHINRLLGGLHQIQAPDA